MRHLQHRCARCLFATLAYQVRVKQFSDYGLVSALTRSQIKEREHMSKRAAIYARVSTDDQRGNYSVPTQIADCLKYIQGRGYKLVGDRFVDPESGRDAQRKKGAMR